MALEDEGKEELVWQSELTWGGGPGPQGAVVHSPNLGGFKVSSCSPPPLAGSQALSSGLECKSLALAGDTKQHSNTGMCGKAWRKVNNINECLQILGGWLVERAQLLRVGDLLTLLPGLG